MSVSIIDTTTDSLLYDEDVQLEGVVYNLRFWWSPREAAWYMDINDQDGIVIAPFIRLALGASLLRKFTDPRLPPGMLICSDLTDSGVDVTSPLELGTRVLLTYISSDDESLQ